jgi:large subunit ribosomal protein L4
MKVDVIDITQTRIGEIELSDELFSISPRGDVLSRVIRWQLAKRRAGTHSAKTISEVSGSGKKIVKQKGSGGARHGSRRGTQFRGGGIVFGPTPRSYEYSLPKKVRRLGLRMAIADKINSGEVLVLDSLHVDMPNTKLFASQWAGQGTSLFIDNVVDVNVAKSIHNCHNMDVLPQIGLNVYDIIRKDYLILTKSAVETLEARLHG